MKYWSVADILCASPCNKSNSFRIYFRWIWLKWSEYQNFNWNWMKLSKNQSKIVQYELQPGSTSKSDLSPFGISVEMDWDLIRIDLAPESLQTFKHNRSNLLLLTGEASAWKHIVLTDILLLRHSSRCAGVFSITRKLQTGTSNWTCSQLVARQNLKQKKKKETWAFDYMKKLGFISTRDHTDCPEKTMMKTSQS
jgi:hypothetical protein